MSFASDLKLKYHTASIIEKLIAVNGIAFVFFFVLKTIAYLFELSSDALEEWLFFPKEITEYIYKPWTIITYAFLHSGLWHLASNMIVLYFSGRYFLTYFNSKRVLTVYFLGAITGALIFVASYSLFPVFSGLRNEYLVGASASVMAILIAVATYVPNLSIRLLFLGNVKFWWIAVFFVILDIIQIRGTNAGGHFAHLGGALFGYLYARQLKQGRDIGSGFEKFMDRLVRMGTPRKKSTLTTVHRAKTKTRKKESTTTKIASSKTPNQAQIDAILDKISKSGYESLTKQEKDFLFKAGKE